MLTMAALAIISASAWLGFMLSQHKGIRTARVEANHRLDLFASAVDGVVKRLESIPATIQLNQDVLALLREQNNPRRVNAVNTFLRRLSAHVGSISAFVLNDRGVVLASSNSDQGDDSSIGEDVSFRPYFLDALSGRVARHFALGIKGSQPGYFVSHPIHDGAKVVGVATLKISLEPIEQTWEMLGAPGLLSDVNQVVIMASNPAWRYTALGELSLERRVDLQLTRMYNNLRIAAFPLAVEFPSEEDGKAPVQSRSNLLPALQQPPESGLLVLSRALDGTNWRLTLFADLKAVRNEAAAHSVMAAMTAGFVVLLGLHLAQRRRIVRQKLEAKLLLERVNAELEVKVDDRTRDLTEANARLRSEVAEREQAEKNLRATQSELVHAAKMAALGQLATGITHELTQPLGAIRTLSGNAVEFMRRQNWESLSGNLRIIGRLADQMGSIIHPLKSFARKSQPIPAHADVAHAIGNALFLYDLPLRKGGVRVVNRCVPGQLNAWCDANRLEQVVINLIGNAIDAMSDSPTKILTLQAMLEISEPPHNAERTSANDVAWIRIDVLDTGTGFTDEARAQLFEPFFTTKPSGAGLGLGLAISRDILREFDGEIEAADRPEGGARFSLRLPASGSVDRASGAELAA